MLGVEVCLLLGVIVQFDTGMWLGQSAVTWLLCHHLLFLSAPRLMMMNLHLVMHQKALNNQMWKLLFPRIPMVLA